MVNKNRESERIRKWILRFFTKQINRISRIMVRQKNRRIHSRSEGRTGVFSWWVVGWYFPWNVNLGNYSSWFVTWRFCVSREDLGVQTDTPDFTTLVRVVCRGWLRYAICNMEPWLSLSVICFLQTLFLDRLLSRVSYVLIFVIR